MTTKIQTNKVLYRNRYKDEIIFEHIGDEVIMTGGSWFRLGLSNEDNSVTMVDPSGGPYIALDDNLNKFWPRGEYQDLIVESIRFAKEEPKDKEDYKSTVVFKIKQ